MRALVLLLILLPLKVLSGFAQATNPVPQNLPYFQNFGTAPFSILPPGMASWKFVNGTFSSSDIPDSQSKAEATAPTLDAPVTPKTVTLQNSGSYGLSISSNARFYIQAGENNSEAANQLVLAVKTRNKSRVRISYIIRMELNNNKKTGVVLQFRVGSGGAWQTADGTTYYHGDDKPNGTIDTIRFTDYENRIADKDTVQFRWATWVEDIGAQSTGFSIDDINVVADDALPPTINSQIVPRFTQGNGSGTNRLPFVCGLRITNLRPNAEYRYFSKAVLNQDSPLTGSGISLFVPSNPLQSVKRSSSPDNDFDVTGRYGTFTTDASGTYSGWFAVEPTAVSRFQPNQFIRLRLFLNDGDNGTQINTVLTARDSSKVINFGNTFADGTAIYGFSNLPNLRGTGKTPKRDLSQVLGVRVSVVVLHSDVVAGGQQPISTMIAEDNGLANTTAENYPLFYEANIDAVEGAWASLVPNDLPTGVRRIESRTINDVDQVEFFSTDSDGIWSSGVNTVNPSGGLSSPLIFTVEDVPLPVEIIGFTGSFSQGQIRLTWRTVSEWDNAGFAILRQGEGEATSVEIARYSNTPSLRGRGTTSNETNYAFTDNSIELQKTYRYQLRSFDFNGATHDYPTVVSVYANDTQTGAPTAFRLFQNYPNPFNPTTTIPYQLTERGFVTLKVYDILGREIQTLVNDVQNAGSYSVLFNSSTISSGIYFYRLEQNGLSQTGKMIFAK